MGHQVLEPRWPIFLHPRHAIKELVGRGGRLHGRGGGFPLPLAVGSQGRSGMESREGRMEGGRKGGEEGGEGGNEGARTQ